MAARELVAPEGGFPVGEYVPPPELTIHQKYALMYLRKSGQDSLPAKLVDTMSAMGIRFTPDDMRALAERGYARRTDRSGGIDNPFASNMLIRLTHTPTRAR